MKKILLSAFACDPTQGSELGNGWNWAIGLARQGYEVHCLTRDESKNNIEGEQMPGNLHFHYIKIPFGLERLYTLSQPTMYLHYILWQWLALKKGKSLHRKIDFELAHHVTWGSLQMGSFLYKLGVPFIFGPAGGGQVAPLSFKRFFANHWKSEAKREKISKILTKWNPGFRTMVKSARAVLVSNTETFAMAKEFGAKSVHMVFDVGLPASFFPDKIPTRKQFSSELKLLWVGRFLPRKGILLIVEVMAKLKSYPGIQLTVVGDGEMKEVFLKSIDDYKLQDQIRWVGKVPFSEVKNFYASHDAFFFTSLRDSGGVQLVEAMAYGLPVITLDLHGSGMIVNDDCGIKISVGAPNDTIDKLANEIVSLYFDREKLTTLSKGAFSFAKQHSWDSSLIKITNQFYQ